MSFRFIRECYKYKEEQDKQNRKSKGNTDKQETGNKDEFNR